MRLELGKIFIKDVQFCKTTRIENSILYINKEEMLHAISGDDRIESLDIELAHPGEEVENHSSKGCH